MPSQHILLIGFKNVGKSTIGKALALKMKRDFVDLDNEIQDSYERQKNKKISCRQIMEQHGERFFHKLEYEVLEKNLAIPQKLIIALGGGTPLQKKTRELLKRQLVVHITAPQKKVLERIMSQGKPAFFPKNKDIFQGFQEFWKEREPIFKNLADLTINNNSSIENAVQDAQKKIHKQTGSAILLLIHGPNLNLLGKRDPAHYGKLTLKELEQKVEEKAKTIPCAVRKFQSNHEGALIDWIQENSGVASGIIINAGALTHYSYALHDALLDTGLPCVEVHLSKVKERESWRKISVIRGACRGVYGGKKEKSYLEALDFLASYLAI